MIIWAPELASKAICIPKTNVTPPNACMVISLIAPGRRSPNSRPSEPPANTVVTLTSVPIPSTLSPTPFVSSKLGYDPVLCFNEVAIQPSLSYQLIVVSLLYDATVVEYHDQIGISYGRQPVCHHERGAIFQQCG